MNGESSWLKDGVEAIKKIVDEAVSVEPKVLALPQEKPGTYAVYVPGKPGDKLDQMLQVKVAGPTWHNELLADIDNLVAFVEKYTSASGTDGSVKEGVVFVDTNLVTFIYDANDRRDRASSPLAFSEPWQILMKALGPIDQRSIIRLLRINFAGALPTGSNLISILRDIKFDSSGNVESKVNHGNVALGKKISNQITGVDSIPEEFVLNVEVFRNFPFKVSILCALELHPELGKFEIVPYPNQLERGLQLTLEAIRAKFASTDVPSFVGAVRTGQ